MRQKRIRVARNEEAPMNPTPAEQKVIVFSQEHPKMFQRQVAEVIGYSQGFVSRTWKKYLPVRIKKVNKDGEPSEIEKRIIAFYAEHQDMMQKDIAAKLGCHRSTVSHTISRYVTNTATRKVRNYRHVRKSVQVYRDNEKKERFCNMCGEKFTSLWAGNRRCPDCQDKVEYQYMPHYSVCIEGHGRV